MRIILFTGKGGVGKTSVAAATAVRAAELGYRTIALSTDAAHSLSDSFEVSLGSEPQTILPNLWGQETEMSQTLQTYWETIRRWMAALLAWRGMDKIVADEMAVLPGMEELANLLYIVDYHDEGKYDAIIVDCAPTADTLRLLSFPEILRWWMDKMFPIGRTAAGLLRPLVKPVIGIPMPDNEVFDSAQHLFDELDRMHTLLSQPDKASVRLVLNPEKMVIKESQRTFTYLNLYGYSTDLVVCNRLMSDKISDSYFDSWKKVQSRYHQIIEDSFAPIPVRDIPLFAGEVVGVPSLRTMAEFLYGDEDPTKVFFQGRAHEIHKKNGSYVLTLTLPLVNKEDISLTRTGDELIVQVGRYKRNIILPRTLVGLSVKGAKFADSRLEISFEEEHAKKKGR